MKFLGEAFQIGKQDSLEQVAESLARFSYRIEPSENGAMIFDSRKKVGFFHQGVVITPDEVLQYLLFHIKGFLSPLPKKDKSLLARIGVEVSYEDVPEDFDKPFIKLEVKGRDISTQPWRVQIKGTTYTSELRWSKEGEPNHLSELAWMVFRLADYKDGDLFRKMEPTLQVMTLEKELAKAVRESNSSFQEKGLPIIDQPITLFVNQEWWKPYAEALVEKYPIK